MEKSFCNGKFGSINACVFKDPNDNLWKVVLNNMYSEPVTEFVSKSRQTVIILAEQSLNEKFQPVFIKD